ncbi:response regulator transcription factor [Owenweeksia hongkongensis]|uniref:Phosphate regulon transcriptional regulatory protein PhoB n=1 Tax=Owenweeksia hongkongensis (strain DSM 17368 / CIP 108786 / JCM 12287 / NRRL B-23963 / UST20020801) TaxID=926562 RepID=G8R473_OWEHD|nr:response regulator transcription factor [Owenweeksia hongkongensis]AEV33140.1 response regulator with CheY-like receiver domain and winged-helix DNA-binding domain [Owenweeksia hongkongensis DSM 17368]
MNNSDFTLLLVDDEPDILEFVSYNLKKEGFNVLTAPNGEAGLKLAKKEKPQLILLDVMMPGMDGIETCDQIRKVPDLENSLIAFLTARGEDYSQVAGFDAGADDYITKPIKPKVLVSRIKALLRRYGQSSTSTSLLEFGDLSIDLDKYQVNYKEQKLDLPRKEFELLTLLTSRPGKVFHRDEILDKIWGNEVVVGGRTIDVHIRKLREKIGEKYIKTVKGVGYKFQS